MIRAFKFLALSLAIAAAFPAGAATIGFDVAQAGYNPTPGVVQEVKDQFGSLGVVFRDVDSPGHGAIAGRCGPGNGPVALFGFGNDYDGCGDTTPNLDIVFVDPSNISAAGYTTSFSIYNYDGLVRASAYDSLGSLLGMTHTFTGSLSLNGIGNISRVNLRSLDLNPTTMDTLEFGEVNAVAAAVPEPSTYALMFGGFAAVAAVVRKRKSHTLSL